MRPIKCAQGLDFTGNLLWGRRRQRQMRGDNAREHVVLARLRPNLLGGLPRRNFSGRVTLQDFQGVRVGRITFTSRLGLAPAAR